jgi:hypothetical protein
MGRGEQAPGRVMRVAVKVDVLESDVKHVTVVVCVCDVLGWCSDSVVDASRGAVRRDGGLGE